jgi:sulfide:quinone oxidoreductase
VPPVVEDSGLAVDGWIAVIPFVLKTAYPDFHVVGDVTSVGTPKAGVFSEGQASVVTAEIASPIRGRSEAASFDGHGTCCLEFGLDIVARDDVTFLSGQAPEGGWMGRRGPSRAVATDNAAFGTDRIGRWFDRSRGPGPNPH